MDSIIQTLKFEDGVAPPTDLRGVPEFSHDGVLVFVKKFIFQKDFRSYMRSEVSKRAGKGLWGGSDCSILKGKAATASKIPTNSSLPVAMFPTISVILVANLPLRRSPVPLDPP